MRWQAPVAESQARPASALWIVALLLSSACSSDSATAPGSPVTAHAVANAVVGDAASALDGHGRFRLMRPRGIAAGEISAERAQALSGAYMASYGELIRDVLEKQHGGPIRIDALHACGRPLYARSTYLPLPETVDRAARSTFAPWWAITLCDGSAPAVLVAVSAIAADVGVDGHGRLTYTNRIGGNEFIAVGVPPNKPYAGLPTPEEAVVRAHQATGRRISAVPELVAGTQGPFHGAWWRLQLETPATVERAKEGAVDGAHPDTVVTIEVGVRARDLRLPEDVRLITAAAAQPSRETYSARANPADRAGGFVIGLVERDPAVPAALVPVLPVQEP